MRKHEKKPYFDRIRERYHAAKKAKKGQIFEECCETCGYNRKYTIRKFNTPVKRKKEVFKRNTGRPHYEKNKLLPILVDLWLATTQMRSKKVKAAIPE